MAAQRSEYRRAELIRGNIRPAKYGIAPVLSKVSFRIRLPIELRSERSAGIQEYRRVSDWQFYLHSKNRLEKLSPFVDLFAKFSLNSPVLASVPFLLVDRGPILPFCAPLHVQPRPVYLCILITHRKIVH